jgi:diaminopropionate ammonia-lyase
MDGFLSVSDDEALSAVDRLRRPLESDPAIEAGPSGACGLAALVALMTDDDLADVRHELALGPRSTVLIVVTEGPG